MPSIERPLSGDVLVFDLDEERERAADPDLIDRSGRNARTLLKNGPLRVTLDEEHDLAPGQLLAVGPGIRHRVTSERGATFLLTVSHPERE